MSSNYSKDQFFGSNNMNIASETNSVQATTDWHVNIPYVTVQNESIHSSNPYYGNPEVSMMAKISQSSTVNSFIHPLPIVQDIINIDQPIRPVTFFYQPPNDLYNYHIICKKISAQSLNE